MKPSIWGTVYMKASNLAERDKSDLCKKELCGANDQGSEIVDICGCIKITCVTQVSDKGIIADSPKEGASRASHTDRPPEGSGL